MLDRLESAINRAADVDWLWWPFLFMRPKQRQQRISLWRVLLFGVVVTIVVPGLLIPLRIAMNRRILFAMDLVPYLFVFATSFFGVVAYFWNRRAGRLALGGEPSPNSTLANQATRAGEDKGTSKRK